MKCCCWCGEPATVFSCVDQASFARCAPCTLFDMGRIDTCNGYFKFFFTFDAKYSEGSHSLFKQLSSAGVLMIIARDIHEALRSAEEHFPEELSDTLSHSEWQTFKHKYPLGIIATIDTRTFEGEESDLSISWSPASLGDYCE